MLESCPSGRRCSTRNAVWGNSPRVRIPNSPPEKVITASAEMAFCFEWDSKDERHRATVRWTVVTASDQATAVARVESLTLRQTKSLENIRFLRDLFFWENLEKSLVLLSSLLQFSPFWLLIRIEPEFKETLGFENINHICTLWIPFCFTSFSHSTSLLIVYTSIIIIVQAKSNDTI